MQLQSFVVHHSQFVVICGLQSNLTICSCSHLQSIIVNLQSQSFVVIPPQSSCSHGQFVVICILQSTQSICSHLHFVVNLSICSHGHLVNLHFVVNLQICSPSQSICSHIVHFQPICSQSTFDISVYQFNLQVVRWGSICSCSYLWSIIVNMQSNSLQGGPSQSKKSFFFFSSSFVCSQTWFICCSPPIVNLQSETYSLDDSLKKKVICSHIVHLFVSQPICSHLKYISLVYQLSSQFVGWQLVVICGPSIQSETEKSHFVVTQSFCSQKQKKVILQSHCAFVCSQPICSQPLSICSLSSCSQLEGWSTCSYSYLQSHLSHFVV